MKKVFKRMLPLLLATVLIMAMIPMTAFAESGDYMSNAVTAYMGSTYSVTWNTGNDHTDHYIKFTAPSRGFLEINFDYPIDSDGYAWDLLFQIYNSSGNLVWESSSEDESGYSDIKFLVGLNSGTYYLNVTLDDWYVTYGSFTCYYTLKYQTDSSQIYEWEPNNSKTVADQLVFNKNCWGTAGESDTASDFWYFDAASANTYKLYCNNYSNADYWIFYNSSGTSKYLYSTDMRYDSGGNYFLLNATAGTNYLEVKTYGGPQLKYYIKLIKPATPLSITKQPQSVSAAENEWATVSVQAQGDGLKYTWYVKDKNASSWTKSSVTSSSYSIQMVPSKDGRQVYCKVTDQYGSSMTTNTATMSLRKPVQITRQPVSASAAEGGTVTVSFAATGDGLTYKWYYKDAGASSFTLTNTFTGNTYTTTMTEARNGRQIYCVVKDRYGNSARTDTVTISMKRALKITSQPYSVTVPRGQRATVSFTAQGDGLSYAWWYKDASAANFTRTYTFSGNTYYAEMNEVRNGRQIYCVVTDKYGNSVQTDVVTINMEIVDSYLEITQQPVDVQVPSGQDAVVTFTAEGEGLTYKWYYRNKGDANFLHTTTFSGNTYTAQMNTTRDGRQIYCVVTDMYGNSVQTDVVTISMTPGTSVGGVTITSQPQSVTVPAGQQAVVTFTAEGEGLTYAWYYKNAWESSFARTYTFTGNTYSAQMDSTRNGRQVYCVVTDIYGNTAQTDTVSINMTATQVNRATITKQPTSVTVASGATATVSFTATGDGLTYAWYYKNSWESGFTRTYSFTGNTYSAVMDSTRNGRQLYCVVTDQYGNTAQTNTVSINMIAPQVNRATITSQPQSVTVANGATATVSFTATGDGLSYAWYYKNSWESSFTRTYSFTGNTYSALMDSTRHNRQLYCVVTDQYGNSVQTNTVTIKMTQESMNKAKIVTQPQSVTVANGATATVSFTATGDGLTYKWYYKNSGDSQFYYTSSFTGNSYSVQMNSARNGRQVYCEVTDQYGNTARTNTVTLSMTATTNSETTAWNLLCGSWDCIYIYDNEDDQIYTASEMGINSYMYVYTDKTGYFKLNTTSSNMTIKYDGYYEGYYFFTVRFGNDTTTTTLAIDNNPESPFYHCPILEIGDYLLTFE